jgi:hypothetical protein
MQAHQQIPKQHKCTSLQDAACPSCSNFSTNCGNQLRSQSPLLLWNLQAEGGSSSQPQPQLRAGDLLWSSFVSSPAATAAAAGGSVHPLPHIVDAAAACTILFSSGTTVSAFLGPFSFSNQAAMAVLVPADLPSAVTAVWDTGCLWPVYAHICVVDFGCSHSTGGTLWTCSHVV